MRKVYFKNYDYALFQTDSLVHKILSDNTWIGGEVQQNWGSYKETAMDPRYKSDKGYVSNFTKI